MDKDKLFNKISNVYCSLSVYERIRLNKYYIDKLPEYVNDCKKTLIKCLKELIIYLENEK